MKKSEWLDCQRNEFFPKQKGIPSLVKIEHINTATLDSARSKKKSKVAVLQLGDSHTIETCTTAGTILIIVSLINIFLLVTLFQNFTLTSYNDQISDRQSI